MVHKLAKILIIFTTSVMLAYILSQLISNFLGSNDAINENSWGTAFLMVNFVFGWFIYAIPLAIIGFKIYPQPKKTMSKK